jgi:hypothetical protein
MAERSRNSRETERTRTHSIKHEHEHERRAQFGSSHEIEAMHCDFVSPSPTDHTTDRTTTRPHSRQSDQIRSDQIMIKQEQQRGRDCLITQRIESLRLAASASVMRFRLCPT